VNARRKIGSVHTVLDLPVLDYARAAKRMGVSGMGISRGGLYVDNRGADSQKVSAMSTPQSGGIFLAFSARGFGRPGVARRIRNLDLFTRRNDFRGFCVRNATIFSANPVWFQSNTDRAGKIVSTQREIGRRLPSRYIGGHDSMHELPATLRQSATVVLLRVRCAAARRAVAQIFCRLQKIPAENRNHSKGLERCSNGT
jgi:hypothetical protein